MSKRNRNKKKKQLPKSSKKVAWVRFLLYSVIILELVAIAFLERAQCMNRCIGDFTGPYPEIACKYECPYIWGKAAEFFKK